VSTPAQSGAGIAGCNLSRYGASWRTADVVEDEEGTIAIKGGPGRAQSSCVS